MHHHLAMFIDRVIMTTNRSEAFVLLQTPKNYGNNVSLLFIAPSCYCEIEVTTEKLQMIFIPVMILYGPSSLSSAMACSRCMAGISQAGRGRGAKGS